MKNGLKFSDLGIRDKKLEKQMQKEIKRIIDKPEYKNLPMLIMNSLKIEHGQENVLIDLSVGEYNFIIARCLLKGDKA